MRNSKQLPRQQAGELPHTDSHLWAESYEFCRQLDRSPQSWQRYRLQRRHLRCVTPRSNAWSPWSVFSRDCCRLVHNQYGYVRFAALDSQSQLIFQGPLP